MDYLPKETVVYIYFREGYITTTSA